MKILNVTFRRIGLLLCSALLLFACSKKSNNPIQLQLTLSPSATEIDESDEVDFTVTGNGKTIEADIYVDGTKITGSTNRFNKIRPLHNQFKSDYFICFSFF